MRLTGCESFFVSRTFSSVSQICRGSQLDLTLLKFTNLPQRIVRNRVYLQATKGLVYVHVYRLEKKSSPHTVYETPPNRDQIRAYF
jgi:hypothetical protein